LRIPAAQIACGRKHCLGRQPESYKIPHSYPSQFIIILYIL
jgi:hypothetical protein